MVFSGKDFTIFGEETGIFEGDRLLRCGARGDDKTKIKQKRDQRKRG